MEAERDLYTESVINAMKSDPAVKTVYGDAVDSEGHLGWADFGSGRITIPTFESIKNWYTGKKADAMDYIKEVLQGVIYKHEKVEQNYKGSIPHAEMEVENLKSTMKGTDLDLAEKAVFDLGIEQGTDHAREVAEISNIADVIKGYSLSEKYKTIRDGIAEILGITEPREAYATA